MEKAYLAASNNGQYPAAARQIMYAARPYILQRTGLEMMGDKNFTQRLLPSFRRQNLTLTADWRVQYDPRGSFFEPHSRREVRLGSQGVDEYLSRKLTSEDLSAVEQVLADVGPADSLRRNPVHRERGLQ